MENIASKKVLILSSSPRKGGNSDILCDQFMRGAREAGHSTEKIALREHKINYCLGCEACMHTQKCVQKDSMNDILAKMVDADVLVFSTPVYFYSVCGQMKTLIDRTIPRFREFKGKAYLIATCADTGESAVEGTISDYRNFLRMTPELIDSGHIYGFNAWAKGDILGNPAIMQAYEAGKNIPV
jgi:multimeric flavodoxin WrbA